MELTRRRKVPVGITPCGTANAMAQALHTHPVRTQISVVGRATLAVAKGKDRRVDVIKCVQQPVPKDQQLASKKERRALKRKLRAEQKAEQKAKKNQEAASADRSKVDGAKADGSKADGAKANAAESAGADAADASKPTPDGDAELRTVSAGDTLLARQDGGPVKLVRSEIQNAFKQADKDSNGVLGFDEIAAIENKFGLPPVISAETKEEDVKIDISEFTEMLEENGNLEEDPVEIYALSCFGWGMAGTQSKLGLELPNCISPYPSRSW